MTPAAIFLLALALRLLNQWFLRADIFSHFNIGDAASYDSWAKRVAGGEWLGQEVFYQAPLYPYLLGLVYSVSGDSAAVARLAQNFVGAASPVLVYFIGLRLFERRTALLAGVLAALYVEFIAFDNQLLKPVYAVFFFCLFFLAALRAAGRPARPFPWLLAGLALGLLVLLRGNAYLFLPCVLAWLALSLEGGLGARLRAAAVPAAVLLAGFLLALLPALVHNYIVSGGDIVLSTSQAGSNFYIGNGPLANGSYVPLRPKSQMPLYERADAVALAEEAAGRKLEASEVSRFWFKKTLSHIAEAPGRFLYLLAKKFFYFWNGAEFADTVSRGYLAESSPVLRYDPVGFWLVGPLSILGMVLAFRRRRRLALAYLIVAAMNLSVMLFYMFNRYRLIALPVLILFASYGIIELYENLKEKRLRRLAGAAALLALATVVAVWPVRTGSAGTTYYNLGKLAMLKGDWPEARDRFKKALELDPGYDYALVNLGDVYYKLKAPEKAVEVLEEVHRREPRTIEGRYTLAASYYELGRKEEALEQLRIILGYKPDDIEARTALAIMLAKEGRLAEAVAECRRVLEISPGETRCAKRLPLYEAGLGRGAGETR